MSDTPAIRLKRGEGRAFKAGGPWIYDNEIAEILGEPADGGIVRIEDYNGYPLGVGFLNRASTIAVYFGAAGIVKTRYAVPAAPVSYTHLGPKSLAAGHIANVQTSPSAAS